MGGYFAPGVTGAVGIDIDLISGTDAVKIRGGKTADTFVFGSTGATFNADLFKDIAFANVDTFVVSMSDGDDTFSGAGSVATGGAAFATAVTVYGGAGNDTIRGGAGDDTLDGGDGNDTFNQGTATDGADIMTGGAGADTADYSARTNAVTVTIDATANDGEASEADKVSTDIETVKGGAGNDTITGGLGNDTLYGDAGNDTFNEGAATSGADVINGGAGTDTASYALRSVAVTVVIDGAALDGESGELDKVMTDVENVTGGDGDDTITGSASDNVLDGGLGNDTLNGGLGNDTLKGGAGNDVENGDAGDDTFDEGSATNGADSFHGGAGIDTVTYTARTNDLVSVMDGVTGGGEASECDLVFTDVENFVGGAGDDAIDGNAADNQLEGGAGVDTINGLAGDDVIDGNVGADVIDCGIGDGDVLLDTTTGSAANCEL
ncbi:MAG: calcium-binding protein [Proteobacteria bacterium]|nr:calcium-binding protein [Pseudomonadota bacterium]